jgi:hypothetical protein
MMITNDDSRVINKLEASLTDDARVVIYDHYMFIVQATVSKETKVLYHWSQVRIRLECQRLLEDNRHLREQTSRWEHLKNFFCLGCEQNLQ